ncbi:MAG: ATP-binding protein, partial [Bacteroidales bacterium]|nr:ATP-binding protein [Bacteroidales bacterium]
ISKIYAPVKNETEYFQEEFKTEKNICYVNITKWVVDSEENSLEKLINVYAVLSSEPCNIGLIFHREQSKSEVYLSVTNLQNKENMSDTNSSMDRLISAVEGNFPGSEFRVTSHDEESPNKYKSYGVLPCLNDIKQCSVASITNIPTEKSEKFVSQTIEKLLDGIVPSMDGQSDYTIILLATPILDIEERKLHLAELYSGLATYAGWQTSFTFTDTSSTNSMATFGVNVGASAGVQNGISQYQSQNQFLTESEGQGETDAKSKTDGQSDVKTEGQSESQTQTEGSGDNVGGNVGGGVNIGIAHIGGGGSYSHSTNSSSSLMTGSSISESIGHSTSQTLSHAVTRTIGKALTKGIADTFGVAKSLSLGANFGANFARASNVTATVGKNVGIIQQFTNYNIKYALQKLEMQMKRLETSSALGFWDFGAYVISKDPNTTNNVAHSYLALTQGEESYMSQSSINFWRGDMGDKSIESLAAKEICAYLKDLRHPIFGLDGEIVKNYPTYKIYPTIVTATTGLSGKELAYSLNFPRKSIAGLPVIECAEFGRNVSTFDILPKAKETIKIGKIFHMHHEEAANLELSKDSLASHTFITGSTGSGKSNTVYKILDECTEKGVNFLVIEPAKGEYKKVFYERKGVQVYGTNKQYADLLRINPFSFPAEIHILEHLDRLVEIFNVCWPMYAAMPAVLKEAVEKSYEDCGWNLTESTNKYRNDLYPTFADVTRNIRTIIDTSEYDAENKGAYKGSLITRLKSLTNGINGLIFSTDEISNEKLFDENVIIDLSRVGSSETKSFIMGLLVLKLQEYRMTKGEMSAPLKHITVLEEAHNLLKRTNTGQSQEFGNLLGKSVEMLTNAIAEMRTYGEGFIIADQAPGLLDLAVIRNTNTKIIMRLPDLGDRELVGKAAALNDRQIEELAKLPCGVAAVYQNEWVQSVLCKVDKFDTQGKYDYKPNKTEPQDTLKERIEMAQAFCQLSNDSEKVKEMLDNAMQAKALYRFSGSLYAASIQYLDSTKTKPDYDKLSFIVSSLFPEFTKTLKGSALKNPSDVSIWRNDLQEHIELALNECNMQEDRNLRNNILQCVLQNYILTELNKRHLLNELINSKAQ